MPENYTDIYAAKNRVFETLRAGVQTLSGILLATQLPEDVIRTALRLLEQENKVKEKQSQDAENPNYTPSGIWPFSR
jgi:hypothetical protein